MRLYFETDNYKLYNGNMLELNNVIADNSIDAVVTDPPYEINFMGRSWDASGIAFQKETWRKCFNALKPGGYLLAFGGSRTFHRIACAIEDAGFEIRDTIIWLYGSGFPKSMNIGLAIDKKNGVESEIIGYASGTMPDFRDVGKKQKEISGIDKLTFGQIENSERKEAPIYKAQNEWSGWGTALKPSFEPVIVARKPCEGTCVDNVLKWGVGGINVDECRVPTNENDLSRLNSEWDREWSSSYSDYVESCGTSSNGFKNKNKTKCEDKGLTGRFPANTILTYDDSDYDEVCGEMPIGGKNGSIAKPYKMNNQVYGDCKTWDAYDDDGSAARYFYCAKASKRDRDEGLDGFEEKKTGELQGGRAEGSAGSIMQNADGGTRVNPYAGTGAPKKNTHPTVKPTSLMQYLIRLVAPKGATILDPFMGSGSTGKATMYENMDRDANYKFVGIELTDEYLPIAKARIDYVVNHGIVLDRGEDETVNEPTEPVEQYEKFGWDF